MRKNLLRHLSLGRSYWLADRPSLKMLKTYTSLKKNKRKQSVESRGLMVERRRNETDTGEPLTFHPSFQESQRPLLWIVVGGALVAVSFIALTSQAILSGATVVEVGAGKSRLAGFLVVLITGLLGLVAVRMARQRKKGKVRTKRKSRRKRR